jgi:hypothetical protein
VLGAGELYHLRRAKICILRIELRCSNERKCTGGIVAGMVDARNVYKILIGKAEDEMPHGLHRCSSTLENITKMGLKGIGIWT